MFLKIVALFFLFLLIRKVIVLSFASKRKSKIEEKPKQTTTFKNTKNWDAETIDFEENKNKKPKE